MPESREIPPANRTPGSDPYDVGMMPSPAEGYPDGIEGVDPFVLWAATSEQSPLSPPPAEDASQRSTVSLAKSDRGARPARQDRRKFVSLLAVSAVGLVTVVTVGGVSFARAAQNATKTPSRVDDDRSEGTTSINPHGDGDGDTDDGNDGRRGKRPRHKPTQSPTPRPSPSSTASPTKTPSPTATPPTGKVIGSTTQATNTAIAFTNPADGQASWLVHMSNGTFVAVEQACTHAGVPVRYNPTTGQFNCPAHGAIFNADGTNPQAPATRPLPPVHITVNANGMITTP